MTNKELVESAINYMLEDLSARYGDGIGSGADEVMADLRWWRRDLDEMLTHIPHGTYTNESYRDPSTGKLVMP